MRSENLIRWGGLAAITGGVLIIIYDVLDATVFAGEHTSEMLTSGSWLLVQILGLAAILLIALASVGLYVRQARQTESLGLIGFVLAFVGTIMVFGVQWSEAFMGPMMAEEAPEILTVEPSGAFLIGISLTFLLFAIGWLILGLATIRGGVFPRGAGVLLSVGGVLFFILAFLELPLWTVILSVAIIWMGYGLWSGEVATTRLASEATT
jgi:hypothetical protein